MIKNFLINSLVYYMYTAVSTFRNITSSVLIITIFMTIFTIQRISCFMDQRSLLSFSEGTSTSCHGRSRKRIWAGQAQSLSAATRRACVNVSSVAMFRVNSSAIHEHNSNRDARI